MSSTRDDTTMRHRSSSQAQRSLELIRSTTERTAVDGVDSLRVHPMIDPELVVAELTIRGHLLADGAAYDQTCVTVSRFERGLVRHHREHGHPLVPIEAHGGHDAWPVAAEQRLGPVADAEPRR